LSGVKVPWYADPGLEKCPACGARLRSRWPFRRRKSRPAVDSGAEIDTKEILWLSAYMVGLALIPLIVVVLVAVVCVLAGR
jgi:hypothetical protein